MEPTTSPKDGRGGTHCFHSGVWLTKGRVNRVDKYQKWAEVQAKSEVQRLDKEEHDRLVKLNGQCLEVRTELRGLKKEQRQISHHRRQSSCPDQSADGAATAIPVSSPPTRFPRSVTTLGKGLSKSPSAGSLTSHSSGYSSLGSKATGSPGGRRSMGGVEVDRLGGEGLNSNAARAARGSAVLKTLSNADSAASRVKNMRSARALSKMNNNMEFFC